MSKNKNYGNYYKNPLVEEPKEEIKEEPVEVEKPTPEPEQELVVETQVTPKAIIQKTVAVVTGAARVNLRKGPSKDFHAIASIPEKTAVKILDKTNDDWYKIEVNDITGIGYMMSKYLKEIR